MRLELDRVRRAREAIDPVFLDSPQYACAPLGASLGCSLTLKVETVEPGPQLKGRGSETVTSWLAHEQTAPAAAVCASAGNLGQALAYSGARRGIAVTVVAARSANRLKIDGIRALGATVRLEGDDIEDARRAARAIADAEGSYLVEDSLDVLTCDGAGTIGLELFERPEELDVVVLALGGGAMASGIGCVARSLAPDVEVVAVQPTGAPAMALSWRRGAIVESDSIDTIADGVAGRFPIPEVLDDLLTVVDDVVLVGEESIKAGMRRLYRDAGLIVEPSAALGVAAVLENRERFGGRRVATVVCGGNVMPADFERWVLASG